MTLEPDNFFGDADTVRENRHFLQDPFWIDVHARFRPQLRQAVLQPRQKPRLVFADDLRGPRFDTVHILFDEIETMKEIPFDVPAFVLPHFDKGGYGLVEGNLHLRPPAVLVEGSVHGLDHIGHTAQAENFRLVIEHGSRDADGAADFQQSLVIGSGQRFVHADLHRVFAGIGRRDEHIDPAPRDGSENRLADPVLQGIEETGHADGGLRVAVIHGLDFNHDGKVFFFVSPPAEAGHAPEHGKASLRMLYYYC